MRISMMQDMMFRRHRGERVNADDIMSPGETKQMIMAAKHGRYISAIIYQAGLMSDYASGERHMPKTYAAAILS